ncbi:MAG: hypothetical protein HY021_10530 [Burkholderiales bacterium]|nr:hypothetical protein [Burkholderiales bacterium]
MVDSAPRTVEIGVLRYRPEQDDEPVWQSYTVPFTDDMSVLQGLQHIKDDIDGSLSTRRQATQVRFFPVRLASYKASSARSSAASMVSPVR